MKLNIFNSWKPLGTHFGKTLEFQTAKAGTGNAYVVYVRDAKTKRLITRAITPDPKSAPDYAQKIVARIGGEAVWQAIETGEPVTYNPSQSMQKQEPEDKKIEWRDGTNHRYRAQRKIVGEQKEEKVKPRNFVAKHARAVNKAGPMKDKKNDYKRKPKHKKSLVEEG